MRQQSRFSRAFYNALGYGMNVKGAFELGVAQMGMTGDGQEKVPRLLVAGVDAANVTFG